MDPFTRRQCKPTMVSNVRLLLLFLAAFLICKKTINTAESNLNCRPAPFGFLQARDPSVHAAILAHLNQKYGSGSAQDPSSGEKNKLVSRTHTQRHSQCFHI